MPLGLADERDYAHHSAASLRQIADDVDRLASAAREGRGVHPEMRAISEHLERIARILNEAVESGSVDADAMDSMAGHFAGVADALRSGASKST